MLTQKITANSSVSDDDEDNSAPMEVDDDEDIEGKDKKDNDSKEETKDADDKDKETPVEQQIEEEDDIDPLDAYMEEVKQEVKKFNMGGVNDKVSVRRNRVEIDQGSY